MASNVDLGSAVDVEQAGNTAHVVGSSIQQSSQMPSSTHLLDRPEGLESNLSQDTLDRFYPFANLAWPVGATFDTPLIKFVQKGKNRTSFKLPEAILGSMFIDGTLLSVNLTNYAYIKFDIEIRAEVNASKFSAGQVQVSAIYAHDEDYDKKIRENVYSLSQTINAVASAGKNSVAVLELPYNSFASMLTGSNNYGEGRCVHNYCNLFVRVLSQLVGGSDASIILSARFKNIHVAGLRRSMLEIKTPLSPPAPVKSVEHQMLSVGKFAVRATEAVLKEAKRSFNMDNPTTIIPSRAIVPISSHSFAIGTGQAEITNLLRLNPTRTTPINITKSETLVMNLIRQPGLFKKFPWTFADKYGKLLFNVPVKPLLDPKWYENQITGTKTSNTLSSYYLPPLAVVSSLFGVWKGSIEYKFDFVSSPVVNGRVIIGFMPGVNDDYQPTIADLKSCNHIIFDLEPSVTTITYTVPYYSNFPSMPIYEQKRKFTDKPTEIGLGVLAMIVLNPLVASSFAVNGIKVLTYVRAGIDFELAAPVQSVLGLGSNLTYVDLNIDNCAVSPNYDGVYNGAWDQYNDSQSNILRHASEDHIAQFINMKKNTIYEIQKQEINGKSTSSTGITTYTPYLPTMSDQEKYKNVIYPKLVFKLFYMYNIRDRVTQKPEWRTTTVYICYIVRVDIGDNFVYAAPFADLETAKQWIKGGCKKDDLCMTFKGNDTLTSVTFGDATFKAVWKKYDDPIQHQTIGRPVEEGIVTKVVDDLPNILERNLGETVIDLKDLMRRFTVYGDATITVDKDVCFGQVVGRFNVTPLGLKIHKNSGRCVTQLQTRAREGTIGILCSPFRFFRGGMRFKIIISSSTKTDIIFTITHQPEIINKTRQFKYVKATRLVDYIASGYGFHTQSTRVNEIVSFEVPYYLIGEKGLLMDVDISEFNNDDLGQRPFVSRFTSLGSIAISVNQKIQEKTDFHVLILYSVADDFEVECFNGFPPMVFSCNIPDTELSLKFPKGTNFEDGDQIIPQPPFPDESENEIEDRKLKEKDFKPVSNNNENKLGIKSFKRPNSAPDNIGFELISIEHQTSSVEHQMFNVNLLCEVGGLASLAAIMTGRELLGAYMYERVYMRTLEKSFIMGGNFASAVIEASNDPMRRGFGYHYYRIRKGSELSQIAFGDINSMNEFNNVYSAIEAGPSTSSTSDNSVIITEVVDEEPFEQEEWKQICKEIKDRKYKDLMNQPDLISFDDEIDPQAFLAVSDIVDKVVEDERVNPQIDINVKIPDELQSSLIDTSDRVNNMTDYVINSAHGVQTEIKNFSEKISNNLIDTSEEVKTEVKSFTAKMTESVSSGLQSLIDLLKEYLGIAGEAIKGIASAAFNCVSQILHVIISPCASTICLSLGTLLVNLGLIGADCVSRVVSAYGSIIKLVFPSLAPDSSKEGQVEHQGGSQLDILMLFNKTVFTSIATCFGLTVTAATHIPRYTHLIMKGIKEFTATANSLTVFLNNNFVYIQAVLKYIRNWKNNKGSLLNNILNHSDKIKAWMKDVDDLTCPSMRQLVEQDAGLQFRVMTADAIGKSLFHQDVLSGCKSRPISLALRDYGTRIRNLYEDLISNCMIPAAKYEPYVIHITGGTGIGKSFIANKLITACLKQIGITTYADPIYTRSPNKFWNSVSHQPGCKYDEFLYKSNGDVMEEQLSDFFSLKSPAIFNPNIANVDEKKKRYAPMVLCLISNEPFPPMENVTTPGAVFRRRDILIHASLKEEYNKNNQIGAKGIPQEVLEKYEHINFQYYNQPGDPAKSTDLSEIMNVDQFLEYLLADHERYHTRELRNYHLRLKEATELHPEKASYSIDEIEEEFKQLEIVQTGLSDYHNARAKEIIKKTVEKANPLIYKQNLTDVAKAEATKVLKQRYETYLGGPSKADEIVHQMDEKKETDPLIASTSKFETVELEVVYSGPAMKCAHSGIDFNAGYTYYHDCTDCKPDCNKGIYCLDDSEIEIPEIECEGPCILKIEQEEKKFFNSFLKKYEVIRANLRLVDFPLKVRTERDIARIQKAEKINALLEGRFSGVEKCRKYLADLYANCSITSILNIVKKLVKWFSIVAGLGLSLFGLKQLYSFFFPGGAILPPDPPTTPDPWHQSLSGSSSGSAYIKSNEKVKNQAKAAKLQQALKSVRFNRRVKVDTNKPRYLSEHNIDLESHLQQGEKKNNFDQLLQLVSRNFAMLYFVAFKKGTKNGELVCKNKILGICGRSFLAMKHFMDEVLAYQPLPDEEPGFKFISGNAEVFFNCEQLGYDFDDNSSIIILHLPQMIPLVRDLRKHVATSQEHTTSNPDMTYVNIEPGMVKCAQVYVKFVAPLKISQDGNMQEQVLEGAYLYNFSQKGYCGNILVAMTPVIKIIGIHIAGSGISHEGFSQPLYREHFDYLTEQDAIEDTIIHQSSPSFNLPDNVLYLGEIPANMVIRAPTKSQIIPSMMYNKFEDYPVETEPAILSKFDKRYIYEDSPLEAAVYKHGYPPFEFNHDYLKEAANHLKNKLIAECQPLLVAPSELLTNSEIFCGINGHKSYKGIELTTSEGFPLQLYRPKGASDKSWLFTYQESPRVLKGLNGMLSNLIKKNMELRKQGIIPETMCIDFLKDCRINSDVVQNYGKTRCFSSCSVELYWSFKKYFGHFQASYVANRIKDECCIGLNPDSLEWTSLVRHLFKKGSAILTADYSHFGDSLYSPAVFLCFEIVISWYEKYFSSDFSSLRRVFAEEIAHMIHIAESSAYRMYCGIASGFPFTVEINSMVNCLYMRYCWIVNFKNNTIYRSLNKFDRHFALLVYGDDLIAAVSDEIKDKFNMIHIVDILAAHNVEIKNATKNNIIIPYTSIFEATFLCRSFIKHPSRAGLFLGSLPQSSITECLYWVNKSNDPVLASVEASRAALNASYGKGPEYYSKLEAILRQFWSEVEPKYSEFRYFHTKSWFDRDREVFEIAN